MKLYRGERTMDGAKVTVDGQPLAPRLDVKKYSDRGFEWSYEGAEPSQLALALLLDHLGDAGEALRLCPEFMRRVVANFDNDWQMSSTDLDAALRNMGVKRD